MLGNQKQRASAARPLVDIAAIPQPVTEGNPSQARVECTVLLVEDDALIRINGAEILRELGFVVFEAGSAEEALATLQAVPIDVLVTDVNLPGLSGPELAERARTTRPGIGVVFATGDSATIVGEGGVTILAKPYGIDALTHAIRDAVGGADREQTTLPTPRDPGVTPE